MPKETKAKRTPKARVEKKKKGMLTSRARKSSCQTNRLPADPNAPKRGLSAYMFFANEQRENVREENPGISFGEIPYARPLSSSTRADFCSQ